jgi:uncharacterized delta-60 repeat protein
MDHPIDCTLGRFFRAVIIISRISGCSRFKQLCRVLLLGLFFCSVQSTHAAAGEIDALFGSNGHVYEFAQNSTEMAAVTSSGGKTYAVGSCKKISQSVCIVRLLASGQRDPSYGTGGIATHSLAGVAISVSSVVFDASGKLIVAARCASNSSVTGLCVFKFLTDGSLDTSFGNTGSAVVRVSATSWSEYSSDVVILDDGSIVVTGNCWISPNVRSCQMMLEPNGAVKASVWNNGRRIGNIVGDISGTATSFGLVGLSGASHVVATNDGAFILVEGCGSGAMFSACVTKLKSDGNLDASFGTNGEAVTAPLGVSVIPNGVTLDAAERIYISGVCPAVWTLCAMRISGDGSADIAYAGAGLLRASINVQVNTAKPYVQRDGKLLTSGSCFLPSTLLVTCLFRFHDDGSPDLGFGTGGRVTLVPPTYATSAGLNVAEMTDGALILGSSCATVSNNSAINAYCVSRLFGGVKSARDCSLDVDGDGRSLLNTDGLIIARALAGHSGDLLAANAIGVDASRKLSAQLRAYLRRQCGLAIR